MLVILGVNTAGGRETGRPAGYILDAAAASLHPLCTDLIVARQRAGSRSFGFIIRITVLGLRSEQAGIHASRDGLDPARSKLAGTTLGIITAANAGKFINGILSAGSCVGYGSILMSRCRNDLRFSLSANGAAAKLTAIRGTSSCINRIPASVRVSAGYNRAFRDQAAGRASLDLRTALYADRCAQDRGIVSMGTGGLADRERNDHKILTQKLSGPGIRSYGCTGSC